jgi:hypothetical protein
VVIATVFLTIIGMTAGFVLGERRRSEASGVQTQTQEPTPTTTAVVPSPGVSGKLCPELTRQTAQRLGFSAALRQVLKIQTANGTTVWICQDDTGGYFYQGKTGGADKPLVEGQNGLFLSKVVRSEDREEYVGLAANGNRFRVSRKQLEIFFAKTQRTEVSQVVESE